MNDLIPADLMDSTSAGAAAAPASLAQAVKIPKGPFRCAIRLPIGAAYEVQATTDFNIWTVVTRNTASDETVEFVDAHASGLPARFYRVLVGGVFSRNLVGYAGTVAPQGFAMIANPFLNEDNTVATLLPRVPENATLCKFDSRLGRLTNNSHRAGKWSFGGERLDPGEGAIFFNPTHEPVQIEFAGEVAMADISVPLATGFSIRGSMVPRTGKICADLGLPIQDGDVVHVFDRKEQRYHVLKFPVKNWATVQPSLGWCEGFWLGKAAAGKWTQKLDINTAITAGVRRPV